MNKAFGRGAILLVGVVLAAVPFGSDSLLAQSLRLQSGVELVPLTVTVTDRSGRYVPGLTGTDFAIFEQGRPQVISHFASDHVAIDMGLVIDTSASMRDRLMLAQKRRAVSSGSFGRATAAWSQESVRPFRCTRR